MIKIKTKRIKEDTTNEYISVSYKTKNTNNQEHLVVVNHLLQEILKTKMYTKEELLKIVKLYLK